MANTDLENKITNAISNIIVALKAKGEKQISTDKIINFIADKYDVVLDNDYINNLLSKSPAVSEINNNKISIGQAPNDSEDAVQDELNNATSFSSPSVGGSGMPSGDFASGGAPMEEEPDINSEEDVTNTDIDNIDDMDAQEELKAESLNIGDTINIKNKQLDGIINEHILYSYRKNNINLKVKRINENGIYCSPSKGDSSLLIKVKL